MKRRAPVRKGRAAARRARLLFLTPPLLQPNTPYSATTHLTGFLESRGYAVEQRDLSIKVLRDILLAYGDETTEELLELLGGPAPAEAKVEASAAIEDLARWIRDNVDAAFGFARYAEEACVSLPDFGALEKLVRRRGVLDKPLERHLKAALAEVKPTAVAVTCPFPGTLVGAFKIARYVKRHCPGVKMLLGGGYVSTELREMADRRPYKYFDEFQFDEGYGNFDFLLTRRDSASPGDAVSHRVAKNGYPAIPSFVKPSYRGIDWGDYFDVVESENPVANLWNAGRWIKLVMARGCYWHKCAFCDVRLPYIGCFKMPKPAEIVDAMMELSADAEGLRVSGDAVSHRVHGYHFADEAMPPALVKGVSEEILRRKFRCEWWGNIRFDAAFTPALARLMARAGCVAVTGGLECADDRLLKLMNKGITLAGARRVLQGFARAGIAVHAYLMYGFPTETADEAYGALETVRGLFRDGLVQNGFWHRFALTVHSPVAREPERFGLTLAPAPRKGARLFARNEIAYAEPGAPDWAAIGADLALAQYNFNRGRGLGRSISFWKGKGSRHGKES